MNWTLLLKTPFKQLKVRRKLRIFPLISQIYADLHGTDLQRSARSPAKLLFSTKDTFHGFLRISLAPPSMFHVSVWQSSPSVSVPLKQDLRQEHQNMN